MCRKEMYWTPEEKACFDKWYGKKPLPKIAKALGKTMSALINRRNKLRLGAFTEAGDMVSMNSVFMALRGVGVGCGYSYQIKSWVENRGFPMHYVTISERRVRMVKLSELWEWLYDNRAFISFEKFARGSLGDEPAWVDEKRKADLKLAMRAKLTPWTPQEDARLRSLLKQYKYNCFELSKMLRRSEGAIIKRCRDLKLKDRPVRIGAHEGKWTPEDIRQLKGFIADGKRYPEISDALNRSEKSIRGLVYRLYKTERLEKVWGLM
ncbi:MAG: SANT/Myb domain-containing protein [Schwartzia sp.]|nr:SANT/Myb domain-containing protein [Schwartzia sp. (in: firmicutes)]